MGLKRYAKQWEKNKLIKDDYGNEWKLRRGERVRIRKDESWEDSDMDPQTDNNSDRVLLDGWAIKPAHRGVIPKFKH